MRVLVLCKRQYTGKDLLDDRYGRLFELPVALAARGASVAVVATSYRTRGALVREERGVRWRSVDALPWLPLITKMQHSEALAWRPNVIWASSDALHLVAGVRLAKRLGVPVILDLYDDYEAFGLTRSPGLRGALRRACSQAQALTAVSQSLADVLPGRGKVPPVIEVVCNGVPNDFAPVVQQTEARRMLGLPASGRLIGTAGALYASRGIADLFDAFRRLHARDSELRLVVAGPRSHSVAKAIPQGAFDLGLLPHAQMPLLMRALDVGVVCNRDTAFGRSCHPQKLVEMVSCSLPFVAAEVGEAARLLSDEADKLYPPGDGAALAGRIASQLSDPRPAKMSLARTWDSIAEQLERALEATLYASH
ncbi:glycosyltransferase family 4 protein [Luteimonas suaedae]|uniref:glycosyltransferase family 4 protein n=1 Tax=Luteimonas suaedae TaxID=2605430 RepID=UPI0011EB9FE0|nr:glycosyltransferase family 4 protein [Luteimonas suaedae]